MTDDIHTNMHHSKYRSVAECALLAYIRRSEEQLAHSNSHSLVTATNAYPAPEYSVNAHTDIREHHTFLMPGVCGSICHLRASVACCSNYDRA